MVKQSNGLFRCDCSLCKNFADYEIVVGGCVGNISLCSDHFETLSSECKNIIKSKKIKN